MKFFKFLFLIFFLKDLDASHHEIYQDISKTAQKSCKFEGAEEFYKAGVSYRKGEKEYSKDSLHSIIYSEVCFVKAYAIYLNKNNTEGLTKSLHNLGMLRLRVGDIASAKMAFEQNKDFTPSQINLKFIQEALQTCPQESIPFIPKDILSSIGQGYEKLTLSGFFDKDWSEQIYNYLIKKEISPVQLTAEELKFFQLKSIELQELALISKEIEELTLPYDKSCIIILGRSPIFSGMMLKARSKFKGSIISIPFSGAEKLTYYSDGQKKSIRFSDFVANKLPLNYKKYFVVDSYTSGATFEMFGLLIKQKISQKKLHGIALTPDDKITIRTIPDTYSKINILPEGKNILLRNSKEIFDRRLINPGKSFYPKDWDNEEYIRELNNYDPFDVNSDNPLLKMYFGQILSYIDGEQKV